MTVLSGQLVRKFDIHTKTIAQLEKVKKDHEPAQKGNVPTAASARVTLGRRPAPLDPIAVPGVESVERQGTGLQAGLAASPNAGAPTTTPDADAGVTRPAVLSGPADLDVPHVSPLDGYSVRLVASRVLYDHGAAVVAVPELADLVAPGRSGSTPRTSTGSASPPAARCACVRPRPRRSCPSSPIRRCRAAVSPPTSTCRWATAPWPTSSTRPSRWSTSGWRRRHPSAHLLAPLLATDPLYGKGVGWVVLLIVLVKVLVVFGALMVAVMLMIWFERKVISDMQSRIGPNRAGPFGIAQTLADGIKLFFKEDLIPDKADRFVFKLAPYLTIIPAFLAFAIVPIGGEVTLFGHTFELQLADPPDGHPVPAGHVGHRRLRHHAGRLVVGLEVPAARLGAGLGPDDLLRGGPRDDRRHGGPGDRVAQHPRPS